MQGPEPEIDTSVSNVDKISYILVISYQDFKMTL